MNTLIVGKNGQLARELKDLESRNDKFCCVGRDDIDLWDIESIKETIRTYDSHLVINTAAYTAVDAAESDPKNAFALNAEAAQNIAEACKQQNIQLVHISTDFVFSGRSNRPYRISDKTEPLGVYGKSKLLGEKKVLAFNQERSCIVRTSWLYSIYGNNFVKTMLRLMKTKRTLNVVSDQIGTPTYAKGLAAAVLHVANRKLTGIYHWSDSGVASWYDFAVAIQELALEKNILDRKITIKPIKTEAYPTPAARPCYSLMDKSQLVADCPEIENEHWRVKLSEMLDALKENIV